MALSHKVFRWPIKITAGSETIRFKDEGSASTDDQTISTATTYVNKGETGTGAPTDMIDAFETLASAANTTLLGAGANSVTVALGTDGRLLVSHDGTGSDDLEILWADGATTFNQRLLGFADATFTVTTTPTKATNQVYGAWYPGVDPVHDSDDVPVDLIHEVTETLDGTISRNIENSATFFRRFIEYDRIPSARVTAARGATAAYATFAGTVLSDPNSYLWVLVEYLMGRAVTGITFPEPGSVYIYSTNDPATHTESAAYQLLLNRLLDDIRDIGLGIDAESALTDHSSEHYAFDFLFVKE